MPKANMKYTVGDMLKNGKIDKDAANRRQKAFDSRREHNHLTLGRTGFIPHGSGQTNLALLKR